MPITYNTIGHGKGWSRHGYGHQESEHDVEYVSEELLSDKEVLDGQSERYQMIEEVMKRHSSEWVCVLGREGLLLYGYAIIIVSSSPM